MLEKLNFLDLFAGAGGMSEGFIRAGFKPVAHVEMDIASCFTLKTRMIYHRLKQKNSLYEYTKYLDGQISRDNLYSTIPSFYTDSVINKTINKESIKSIFSSIDNIHENKKIDLIIGGPPCQAYSIIGRARDPNSMLGDHRNLLYEYYSDFLQYYKPKFFVFENVEGLLSAKNEKGEKHFEKIIKRFSQCGYVTEFALLDSFDFKVPQHRKRVIIIGKKGKVGGFYPTFGKSSKTSLTINDLFFDLPSIQSGNGSIKTYSRNSIKNKCLSFLNISNDFLPITYHISRTNSQQDLEIYRKTVDLWNMRKERLKYNDLPDNLITHKNTKSFLDRFKVVAGDLQYSQNICAHIAKDGHYYIHPDIHQNRSISVREAARLQTFPDDYFFENATQKPGITNAFRQIGNAVPILLAEKIAEKILDIW